MPTPSAIQTDDDLSDVDPKRLPTEVLQAAGRGEVTPVVKWLNKGGEPDTLCHELGGYSILHFAAAKGKLSVAQEVLRRGAKIDLRSRSLEGAGNTALMVAARAGRHELVKVLMERKADLDLQNFEGATALIFAAGNAERECVRLLLEGKANADLRHKDGRTALQTAQGNRHSKTAELILQLAPVARPNEAKDEAKATNGADAAAAVAEAKAKKDAAAAASAHDNGVEGAGGAGGANGSGGSGSGGKEPADPKFLPIEVHKAAASGKLEAVQSFLDGGGDVSARCVTTKDPTIVLAAAARGHLPVVQLALQHGCELESTDCLGHTPLMSSAQGGHVGVMLLLMKARADVDAQDATKATPLMLAARHNQLLAARALVRAGARTDVANEWSHTAEQIAARYGHHELAELIRSEGETKGGREGEMTARAPPGSRVPDDAERERVMASLGEREREALQMAFDAHKLPPLGSSGPGASASASASAGGRSSSDEASVNARAAKGRETIAKEITRAAMVSAVAATATASATATATATAPEKRRASERPRAVPSEEDEWEMTSAAALAFLGLAPWFAHRQSGRLGEAMAGLHGLISPQ